MCSCFKVSISTVYLLKNVIIITIMTENLLRNEVINVSDEILMKEAINQAIHAREHGEDLSEAVNVHDGEVIATGYHVRESRQGTLSHAELIAIQQANQTIGSWPLEDCTFYLT